MCLILEVFALEHPRAVLAPRKNSNNFWKVDIEKTGSLHAMLESRFASIGARIQAIPGVIILLVRFRSFHTIVGAFLCVLVLSSSVVLSRPVMAQESTPESILGEDPNAPCATSRLRIGDLEAVDNSIDGGVQRAVEEAQRWQADARLYTLRLGCPLLTTGVQWEGVFFSETAQAFYSTDTGRVEAVNDPPDTIPTLDPSGLRMREIHRSLIRAGFSDELQLTAQGGVTIRQSTQSHPFGPPDAPRDQTYAHLAIEVDGQITDVWVSISDFTIYRYGN